MRYIITKNGYAQFVETNNFNVVTNTIGYPFDNIVFKLSKNSSNYKVVFYEKNSNKPFTNEVWYSNLPITIDDVVYSDAESATEALGKLIDGEMQYITNIWCGTQTQYDVITVKDPYTLYLVY